MKTAWLTPLWPVPGSVRALATLRIGGVSTGPYRSLNLGDHVGDAAEAVQANRLRLASDAQLPSAPMWLRQVHGRGIADLDATGPAWELPEAADAAVTRQRGRVCAILTADCLPILLATEAGDRVAAAHAGWRGLAAGIIEATVSAMCVKPHCLLAWLGPAIGPAHFEVGTEVRDELLAADGGAGGAFVPNARGRFMADLPALARRRLAAAGVARIYGGGECTYGQPERFFSHRRDGVTGRQASLIWLT